MNTSQAHYPTIGHQPKFYGYVVGMSIENDILEGGDTSRMLAHFEYGGTIETWRVPDSGLFKRLATYLIENAEEMCEADTFMGKVWIEYTNEKWIVDLP